jgi:predicted secreted protein
MEMNQFFGSIKAEDESLKAWLLSEETQEQQGSELLDVFNQEYKERVQKLNNASKQQLYKNLSLIRDKNNIEILHLNKINIT